MKRTAILTLLLPLVAILLAGCANKECYDNQNTLPLATFFSMQTRRAVTLDATTVYGVGAPRDTLIADSTTLSQVYLPFRADVPESSFVFRYEGEDAPQADTVTFRYRTQPWFASEQCGVVYYFHIEGIEHTRHLIDSVAVPGMLITNANKPNIEIFVQQQETDR